jgi:CDP-diacylglycerol---glycerol-3-phosphate 3-phosphatidyltransferase
MKSKDETTSVWTLPNRLSFVRILFIPVIVLLIAAQNDHYLFISSLFFIVAGITDGLDGLIARKMSMTSRLGLYLDPIADKLLISCVLITLSYYHMIPLWITLTLVSREIIINGLRSFYATEGVTIYPSFAGKLKTTLQIVGISCVLFSRSSIVQNIGMAVIYAALLFSIYSALGYIYAIFSPAKENQDR